MLQTYADICDNASARYLEVLGAFRPVASDQAPDGCKTLLLFGPKEPGFWPYVSRQPEFQDACPDPLDRWSERIIERLSFDLGGEAVFPFG